jgi:hypothetical protein
MSKFLISEEEKKRILNLYSVISEDTNAETALQVLNQFYENEIPLVEVTREPNANLFFDGQQLHWKSNGVIKISWKAQSGKPILSDNLTQEQIKLIQNSHRKPEHINLSMVDYSKIKDQGPIPQGFWYVDTLQSRTGKKAEDLFKQIKDIWEMYHLKNSPSSGKNAKWNTGSIKDRIAWGDYRMQIIPENNTQTFGRHSFFIHGGGIFGSAGCIDLATNMPDFVKYYSTWRTQTGKNKLPIEVSYVK